MNAVLWPLLLVAAVACAAVVIYDAGKTAPSYATGYDGLDPGPCASPTKQVSIVAHGQAPLLDAARHRIGTLRLRRSQRCATMWAQVVLTTPAAHQLAGRVIELTVQRPADNQLAPFPLSLHGGQVGFGNQLGATACIRALGQLLASGGQPAGPRAVTACVV